MVTRISYLVTCKNESKSLKNLLGALYQQAKPEGDEVVLIDDFSDNPETLEIIENYKYWDQFHYYQHALNHDYGSHKNFGNQQCHGDWIFQIDGDELPAGALLINLKDIIEANPEIELFLVPRVNDFIGVTPEHARQWGWRLTPCPEYENRPIINWPDYQGRIYKNAPDRIKWDRKLHEKIEGYKKYAIIPPEVSLALYHDKTIETQLKTNLRYNKEFSESDNRGHSGFKQNG